MRLMITGVAILIGITLLFSSFTAGKQFREIATADAAPNLDDYPFLELMGGDLLNSTVEGIGPAEMAEQVQQRLGLLALGGLVFLLIGAAFFVLTKPKKSTSGSRTDSLAA